MLGGRCKELRSKEFPKNLLNDKMPKTKGNEELVHTVCGWRMDFLDYVGLKVLAIKEFKGQ